MQTLTNKGMRGPKKERLNQCGDIVTTPELHGRCKMKHQLVFKGQK